MGRKVPLDTFASWMSRAKAGATFSAWDKCKLKSQVPAYDIEYRPGTGLSVSDGQKTVLIEDELCFK